MSVSPPAGQEPLELLILTSAQPTCCDAGYFRG